MNAILPVDFFRDGKMGASETNGWPARIKPVRLAALMAALTILLTGCGGYVDGGYGGGNGDYGYYGGYDGYYDGGPDIYLFGDGDGYGRGRDAQIYSHRGAESRGFAHARGGGYGGHVGGGHVSGGGGGGHGGGGGRH